MGFANMSLSGHGTVKGAFSFPFFPLRKKEQSSFTVLSHFDLILCSMALRMDA